MWEPITDVVCSNVKKMDTNVVNVDISFFFKLIWLEGKSYIHVPQKLAEISEN
uniref:Uncharacterized protein n=1 Tax=Octopus bimaculoides TaxID=37653 RepID=A0A0L8GKQ5_OCTBM